MNLNPLAVIKSGLFIGAKKPSGLNTLASYLSPENICLDVAVSNKLELFDVIGRHMEREHALPQEWVARSLSRREQAGSTGLGKGVAIPHARVKELERMQVAYMRLKSPIPFDAPDGNPVMDILVLLAPNQADEEHLRILADATQLFSDCRLRARLHQCGHASEVKQLFASWSQPVAPFFSRA
ncbi:MAG: PTS sugar transporter subunit IIA [Pseudomonadota bacterium]